MAVQYITALSAATPKTTNPLDFSFDCSGGTLLVVAVSSRSNSQQYITGVTYGGAALTKAGEMYGNASGDPYVWAYLWYKTLPASGSNTVSVASSASCEIVATAVSFSGASGLGSVSTDTWYETTATATFASAADQICIDCVAWRGNQSGSLAADAGQTERQTTELGYPGDVQVTHGCSTEPGAASVTMTWTTTQEYVAYVAAPVLAGSTFDLTAANVGDQQVG